MKRIMMLMALAAMMAAAMALSGVAQAAKAGNKANAQCKAEAIRTLQPGFKPSDYNFIGGTEGDDFTFQTTAGLDVLCGFGGNEFIGISDQIDEGDIFLGGDGSDYVYHNYGAFYGQEGDDTAIINYGTVYGETGDDYVDVNDFNGTVYGGDGSDYVNINYGTYFGGPGDDNVGLGGGIFVQD